LFLSIQILQAIVEDRPTFLSGTTWTKMPIKINPRQENGDIMDILLLYLDLLKKGARLKELKDHDLLLAAKPILAQASAVEAKFRRFYDNLQERNPGPLYWPILSTAESPFYDPEEGHLFPVAFHFSNLNVASTVLLYWTTLAKLWSGLSRVYKSLGSILLRLQGESESGQAFPLGKESQAGFSHEDCLDPAETDDTDPIHFPFPDHQRDVFTLVQNVCQSVEYFMQEDMLSTGPALLISPLISLIDVLENYPNSQRELSWLKAALIRIQKRGLQILTPYISEEAGVTVG
jgi:hypothetical protein